MKLLTVKQTAEKLSLSEKTIYKYVANKQIPSMRIGGTILISEETLFNYLKRLEKQSVKEVKENVQ